MQREFRKITKVLGYRGWRFDFEEGDRFYLSKFDPIDNDNEYRFYFFKTDDGYQIVRQILIQKYKYKHNIEKENDFYKQAEHILNTYFSEENQKALHTA